MLLHTPPPPRQKNLEKEPTVRFTPGVTWLPVPSSHNHQNKLLLSVNICIHLTSLTCVNSHLQANRFVRVKMAHTPKRIEPKLCSSEYKI